MNKVLSAQAEDWPDKRIRYLKPYDTSMYIKVRLAHRQLLTSARERFLAPLRSMAFEGPGVSVESLSGPPLVFRAEPELVEYYESLESSRR